ncbi:MAG: PDZ domain-containing protein [Sphingomicrobium sp.]
MVDYRIDLKSPEHHSALVSATYPAPGGGSLDLVMPAWRTGRYQIMNLANGVSRFEAFDVKGSKLAWTKIDKSTWRIANPAGGPVTVRYELYANELGRRSRHIDDSHAYLDASAVLMYSEQQRREPVSVALDEPTGWRSFSGMDRDGAGRFIAANWDILVDSPIETGVVRDHKFRADGRDYEVVFWGHGNVDEAQAIADIQKFVPQAKSIWSAYPFQRYLFIVHLTDGESGATEHLNSTVIQVPRYRFRPRDGYLGFIATASHEFIHTWNVKDYRAANMVPYDYTKENYSNLLWLEEGSTEYFTPHLLLRAGVMTTSEYFEMLAGNIDAHLHRPGRLVQSVAEGAFDAWIAQGGDRGQNAGVDIYEQGSIASWALDIALLQQSGGRVSYRDVHEALRRKYGGRVAGFTDADIRAILRDLTGRSWDQWWTKHIDTPGETDFAALLAPVGLEYGADATKPGEAAAKAWAGWSSREERGRLLLTTVEENGPAWQAGFVPDDIMVAIDGHAPTAARLDSALGEHQPGDTLTVTFFRRDQLLTKTLRVGAVPRGKPVVRAVANSTAAQRALFNRWLLIDFPKN